jgi:putative ABC transport system permease protein
MLTHYFKTAIRNLGRHKLYAAINIAGLAVSLAAFWLIALYVADEFSYDRYNANANRIYRVVHYANWDGGSFRLAPTSLPFAPALKVAYPEIEETVRVDPEGGGMIEQGEKKLRANDIIFADNSLFKVFSYTFIYGDAATALVKPQSIVITRTLANKVFGSAEKAINQNLYFDNHFPNMVTGVIEDLPENSHLRFSAARSMPQGYTEAWQAFHIYTYLLLKPGVYVENLEKKLPAFATANVLPSLKVKNYRMELQPLTSIHLHSDLNYELSPNGNIGRLYMFMVIACLILLIAIINYINLSTARSASRVKEIGVRKVTGSGKWRLAGMFMAESVLVTAIAAAISVSFTGIALPYFNQLTGKTLSAWQLGAVNTVLILTFFTFVTGIVSGIYPSVFLSRFNTILALKGQMGKVSATVFFRKTLVVFQFVVTVVMIAGSVIIYQQLRFALHKDLGFNKQQVLTFHINNRAVRSKLPALKTQLLHNASIEGVSAAGNPIGNNDLGGSAFLFEKSDGSMSTNTTIAQELMADADYLPTMQIKLADGRNFSEATPADINSAALVNETLVTQMGWENAVGKHIQYFIDDSGHTAQKTVVGVIKDFHTYSLQRKVDPLVVIMPPNDPEKDNLYVRVAKGKEKQAIAYITTVYKQFDKTNVPEYHFLDQNFAAQYAAEEKQGQIALIFTVLAVVIASLGLFGLATFTAQQRTKEIGIRKVLGANVFTIVQMLSKDLLKLVFAAACIAIPIAWFAMNQWLDGFAYRIDIEWWVLALAGGVAALIALVTVSYQAIKAALANPVQAIKTE